MHPPILDARLPSRPEANRVEPAQSSARVSRKIRMKCLRHGETGEGENPVAKGSGDEGKLRSLAPLLLLRLRKHNHNTIA